MSGGAIAAEAEARRPPSARSRFITGLGIGQICAYGALYYSFPLIAEAMSRDLGWSKLELYGAATLGLLLAALAAYPVGAAIDRGHGRTVMATGTGLAALLLVAWSQVDSLPVFYLLVAAVGCLQAATLYEAAFAVIARRAGPSHARAGITALTLWGGFASTVFIPLVQFLIDTLGWRGALLALGAVLTLCAALYLVVIDGASDDSLPARASDRPPSVAGRSIIAWALRQPTFWALGLALTAYAATFSAFTYHIYPLLLERGFDTATIVTAIAIIGPAQVCGRIGIGVLAPRASVRVIGCAVVAMFPLTLLALHALPPSFVVLAGVGAIYGAANGIMTIVRGLAVPEMLTKEAYGAINGALAAPVAVANALSPVGAALIWTATGSYDGVLIAVIAGSLVLSASFWAAAFLSKGRRFRSDVS